MLVPHDQLQIVECTSFYILFSNTQLKYTKWHHTQPQNREHFFKNILAIVEKILNASSFLCYVNQQILVFKTDQPIYKSRWPTDTNKARSNHNLEQFVQMLSALEKDDS